MYYDAKGIKANSQKALQLFKKAVAQGIVQAEHNLGIVTATNKQMLFCALKDKFVREFLNKHKNKY
jgi:TPR repeat protein